MCSALPAVCGGLPVCSLCQGVHGERPWSTPICRPGCSPWVGGGGSRHSWKVVFFVFLRAGPSCGASSLPCGKS